MRLHVPLRLRWSDIDAYAHVNNAAMLGLLEEARIQAFWVTADTEPDSDGSGAAGESSSAVLDGRPGATTLTLVAHQEVEYLRPIPYGRQPLDCELWVPRIGGSSLDVHYEVWSPAGIEPRVLTTRAATTIVLVDTATQRPRRVTDAERTAWAPFAEPPLEFSRRR